MRRNAVNDLDNWYSQKKRKPLIIRGARQVGKSTLVKLFATKNQLNLIEINLEKTKIESFNSSDIEISKIIQEIEYKTKKSFGKNTLLFIDEIQSNPKALLTLRYFYEDKPDLAVIAAGSLLEFILNDHNISMPVGRIEYYHLGPMTFEEYLIAIGDEKLSIDLHVDPLNISYLVFDKLIIHLREFYYIGGMPEAIKTYIETKSFLEVEKVHRSILETYRDDFPKYASKAESLNLGQLLTNLSQHIGKKIKYSELLKDVKHPAIKKALELLESAKLITKCSHSNATGIPLISQLEESAFKIYFLDIGLLSHLIGLRADDIINNNNDQINIFVKGILAEQFVAQHLKYLSQRVASEQICYWLKDLKKDGAEIDFLIQESTTIIPIEVKSGKTGSLKSLFVFMNAKKLKFAIKFDLQKRNPKDIVEKVSTSIFDGAENVKVNFKLHNFPIFLINFINFKNLIK